MTKVKEKHLHIIFLHVLLPVIHDNKILYDSHQHLKHTNLLTDAHFHLTYNACIIHSELQNNLLKTSLRFTVCAAREVANIRQTLLFLDFPHSFGAKADNNFIFCTY